MVGWHHRLDGHEFEQAPRAGDGQESLVCCSSWGRKELDMTERLNWTARVQERSKGDTTCRTTSQNPSCWHPSWMSNACATRKDSESEWLAKDKPETNLITINPKTVSHVAEQFSWVPLPCCFLPGHIFPIKYLAFFSTCVSLDNSFPSVKIRAHFWALEGVALPATEWEKIFPNHISDKGLIFKVYKELLQSNNSQPYKNWAKYLNRLLSRDDIQMAK